jgi:hypothetical protein
VLIEPFDIQDLYARATLDAVSSIAFGQVCGCQRRHFAVYPCFVSFIQNFGCLDSEKPPEFMIAFDTSQEATVKRTMDPTWKFKRSKFILSF